MEGQKSGKPLSITLGNKWVDLILLLYPFQLLKESDYDKSQNVLGTYALKQLGEQIYNISRAEICLEITLKSVNKEREVIVALATPRHTF